MVTHSDALLRQAVGNANYKVFHMMSAAAAPIDANQAVEVFVEDDVDRVAMDLVGDLATYRPHGKVVVLEGGDSSDEPGGFDVNMIERLFPDFAKRVNLISGGNKSRVRDLYRTLRRSDIRDAVRSRFFAIVDKDSSPQEAADSRISEFTWDHYHIENYLMDAPAIRAAVRSLTGADPYGSDDEVVADLRSCAQELIDGLVLERMQDEINSEFRAAMCIAANPNTTAPSTDLAPSIAGSASRIAALAERLDADELQKREQTYRNALEQALSDNSWIAKFPGRPILRHFTDKRLGGRIQAGLFMMAILDKMAESSTAPAGMKTILDQISVA
jgi:hypothetical protein